jgi:hypothetical protein
MHEKQQEGLILWSLRLILAFVVGLSAEQILLVSSQPAGALEGGTNAYLLGSRDTFAGFVPPPGTTAVSSDAIYISGQGPTLSLGGVTVVDPKVSVWLYKFSAAHFFNTQIFGGTPGIAVSIPYAGGSLTADGVLGRFSATVEDKNSGFADPSITPVIGWHNGNFHYSAAVSFLLPLGKYNLATVSLHPVGVDNALNFGKNRLAIVPSLNATYFDPKTGIEFSGSMSMEFTLKNTATDWQTAPAFIFEGAALEHLKNGLAFGVAGYAYQQIAEDSGTGAINFRNAIGAASLEARVFGIGPIATYTTKIDAIPVNFKLKWSHEFEARRRFESEVVFGSVGFSF